MNGLIRASLGNPYAVTVMSLTLIILGALSLTIIPIDILPVFKSPAVQTLTFYGGMSSESIANDITNWMEPLDGPGQRQVAAGVALLDHRAPASYATISRRTSTPTGGSHRSTLLGAGG